MEKLGRDQVKCMALAFWKLMLDSGADTTASLELAKQCGADISVIIDVAKELADELKKIEE